MKSFNSIHTEFKNKILNRQYNYVSEPLPLKINEYDRALKVFLDKFARYHNIKSIYKFGFISAIGISDLDFIVVLNDPLSKPREDLSYKGFNKKERYIYNNTPPIYMSEEIFKQYTYVLPFRGLKLLYGNEINQVTPENKQAYNILTIIEICTLFYPRVFLDLLYRPKLNIRRALCLLNALQYPVKLMHGIVEVDDRWEGFEKELKNLREKWFQLDSDRYKLLVSLVVDAVYLSLDIIAKTSNYLVTLDCVKKISFHNRKIVGQLGYNYCTFISKFSKDESLSILIDRHEKTHWTRRFTSVLPWPFLAPLLLYKEEEGLLSSHFRSSLRIDDGFKIEFAFKEEARKRINVLNSFMSFIEDNRVAPNGAHIYYDYWPKAGLRNTLTHYLVKFRAM